MTNSTYLAHHGIKGMKWGVRHDKRTNSEAFKKRKQVNDRLFSQSIKQGKGKPNISPAEKMSKEVSRASKETAQELKQKSTQKKTLSRRKVASQMTDAELRAAVNRIKLEREYASLTAQETKTGLDKTNDILETVGTVFAVGSSVLTVASIIKGLK